MNLSFEQAFFRGILCNALVCVAVWLILAGRTIPSKLAGLILPISAFITLGFEHSIANFYLLPAGLMAGAAGIAGSAVANLLAVTLGNLVGGIVVALAIWLAYLRDGTMVNRIQLAERNGRIEPGIKMKIALPAGIAGGAIPACPAAP